MITGSNPRLSYAILGHKISFMYIKPQKGTFICPKLMPKAEKIKKQKINSVPFQTTVVGTHLKTYIIEIIFKIFVLRTFSKPHILGSFFKFEVNE